MDEVSKNEGRTVLFVSHDMRAVQRLCTKLICLDDGRLLFNGEVDKGMKIYEDSFSSGKGKGFSLAKRDTRNKKAYVNGYDVKPAGNAAIQISIFIEAIERIEKTEIAVGINDTPGTRIITLHSRFIGRQFNLEKGTNEFICSVNNFWLKPGSYTMNIFLGNSYETFDYLDNPVDFELSGPAFYKTGIVPDSSQGYLIADHTWTLKTAAHAGS